MPCWWQGKRGLHRPPSFRQLTLKSRLFPSEGQFEDGIRLIWTLRLTRYSILETQVDKMMICILFVLITLGCVFGEAPPIPYSQAAPFSSDHVQAANNQFADHFGSEGFNVQTGYEGYLIPGAEHGWFPLAEGLDLKSHGLVRKVLGNLLALGWKVVPKLALGAVVVLALFLLGGCVNALVCSFTPLCSISFLGLGVTKDTMRSYLTPDRISSTANFVVDAIKKYKDLYETMTNEIETGKKSPAK